MRIVRHASRLLRKLWEGTSWALYCAFVFFPAALVVLGWYVYQLIRASVYHAAREKWQRMTEEERADAEMRQALSAVALIIACILLNLLLFL